MALAWMTGPLTVIILGLWDQALTTFGTTCAEDSATVFGRHTCAETVCARALEIAGLEGALHRGSPEGARKDSERYTQVGPSSSANRRATDYSASRRISLSQSSRVFGSPPTRFLTSRQACMTVV